MEPGLEQPRNGIAALDAIKLRPANPQFRVKEDGSIRYQDAFLPRSHNCIAGSHIPAYIVNK